MTVQGAFQALLEAHPLPEGWRVLETHSDDVRVGGATIRRAAIAAQKLEGPTISGSAASLQGDPGPRAYYELLERLAIVVAGEATNADEHRREARSNGVALYTSFETAAERARLELVERHRLLCSWAGEITPVRHEVPEALQAFGTHEWRCASLGDADADGAVAALIGLPYSPESTPLARGFAAAEHLEGAVDRAAAEAVQGLSFLVGEPIPDSPPEPAPNPIFHLDHYLYPPHHEIVTGWLDGKRAMSHTDSAATVGAVEFVDLTPRGFDGLRVVRARSATARRVFFGEPEGADDATDPSRFHPLA